MNRPEYIDYKYCTRCGAMCISRLCGVCGSVEAGLLQYLQSPAAREYTRRLMEKIEKENISPETLTTPV